MLFTLEALKAKEGDCLLLHWGSLADPRLAVIDGGPSMVYDDFLRPRLDEIAAARGLSQLRIDLVMVSHVDNDHIVGIKALFGDLRNEVSNQIPANDRPILVDRLWHNAFDDIIGNAINAHYHQFSASFEAAADGEPPAGSVELLRHAFAGQGEDARDAAALGEDVAMLLAGHKEGRQLRVDHKALFDAHAIARLNAPFAGTLITAELTPDPEPFFGLEFHIVGPMQAEIDALQLAFDQYLRDHPPTSAEAALAAYADKSVPNLSSIVCMVTMGPAGNRRSMLLTGDARGDKILAGLQGAGYLDGSAGAHLHVDVLKVPHHGSDRNATLGFFKTISADTYIFSGDGKHGNPDRATVEWIIKSRGRDDRYTLVFTYPIDKTDARRKSESHGHWNEAEDAIGVLLEAVRDDGYRFDVRAGAPIAIELGDEKIAW